ncbi:LacI family DNA-binding transcriptional regulator [Coraliomargarita algicola]|uniref:LacI family DNA-binding transcriptional regulator n=1 Tax=Coraliomargarita algicola TaxID=3092156 RepID=A0ABZ0RVF6_9BACT|nr:LacI family DNA-binding transcriptional regulator [Coraliomargarita sp. J2-16]WPJ96949.1 LacI family DNA-binding transcriptional regulator [Coraliomargarita sp. J2-16]
MSIKKCLTLRQIACESGVHFTTVSKILRGQSRASKETRERVLQVAAAGGYRPNPLVSAWMAQRRAVRPAKTHVNVAIIFGGQSERASNRFDRELGKVLATRAGHHGFSANELYVDDYASLAALGGVIRARGIQGIVWAGVTHPEPLPEVFDACAMVSFGGEMNGLSTVRTEAFGGMMMAMDAIQERGCERPLLVLRERPTRRNLIRYEAAFRLKYQSLGLPEEAPVCFLAANESPNWTQILKKFRGIDGVIGNCDGDHLNVPFVSLDARPGRSAGLDQRRSHMGEIAVDLVATAVISPSLMIARHTYEQIVKPLWVDAV